MERHQNTNKCESAIGLRYENNTLTPLEKQVAELEATLTRLGITKEGSSEGGASDGFGVEPQSGDSN